MVLITIRERASSMDSINDTAKTLATVSFDHGPEYSVIVSDPFSSKEEARLEWYFEEYLHLPFTDQVKAGDTANSIAIYGEKLFNQVFTDRHAYAKYRQALQAGLPTLQIEIAGSPSFHRLHWEALKDPDLLQPLALQCPIVRKNLTPQPIEATIRPSPTINTLIVTARPGGRRDVGYRTISRPLVEALRQTDLPVKIDILRPGTYKSLHSHLQEVTDRNKATGYYHIIHFDVHGSLLAYEQFKQLQQSAVFDRYTYSNRYGRPPLQPYKGYKAFLSFEDEQEEGHDLVEANELASLLLAHQIPIAILNACQSAKQVGTSETSLGSHLIQAGMQLVLAMSYSVTVSAAEIMMRTLYSQLFDGYELPTAICHARQELYNNKKRRAYFDQFIDLEDWLLPVVYQNQPLSLKARRFQPEEERIYDEQRAISYKVPQPSYGFVGRDLDILLIEKRLLSKRNILLVRGMGGAGKTTLLHHLASWWQTTGFVKQAFYFGYDEQAWTLQQIMHTIANQIFSKREYFEQFQPLSLQAQWAKLSQRLRAHRYLLILDNLESIVGSHLAIRHTLPQEEQALLRSSLSELVDGRTLILLGSRSEEGWMAKETFRENIYELRGLDPEAASTLTNRILERYNVTKYRQDSDLQHLIELLDGFPLALEVVFANLQHQTPKQISDALQKGDISLGIGGSQNRTENILRCIDYSYSNLSPDAQSLLVCLAPFTSVLNPVTLGLYTDNLKQHPALAHLPFERWPEVIQETQNWGLLSRDPDFPDLFLHIQPTLPYFLRSRLNTQEQAEMRAAIETSFREHYNKWCGAIFEEGLEGKDATEKRVGQAIVGLEYENLMMALNLALEEQVSIENPYKILMAYLESTQDYQRGIELGQMVFERLEGYSSERKTQQLYTDIGGVIYSITKCHNSLGQYEAAEDWLKRGLTKIRDIENIDAESKKKWMVSFYQFLGEIAREKHQWEQAQQYCRQALQIYEELNDRYPQASVYYQLARIAEEQHLWEQAQQYYWQALGIYIEFNDLLQRAHIYCQLGSIEQNKREWDQARQHYLLALQIYEKFGDRHSQAGIHHNLGTIAYEQHEWEQAEHDYRQALQIEIATGNRYSQAPIYYQLGLVAEMKREWEQAELYYQQALEIYQDFDNRLQQAPIYCQLGEIAREKHQWKEAQQHCRKALQIYEELNDRYHQASVYYQLALVAEEQHLWGQAQQYYLQALQIYKEFDDRYSQARVHGQLGSIARERKQWKQAIEHLIQALTIFKENQDERDIILTLGALAFLWKENKNKDLLTAVAAVLGKTPREAEQILIAILKRVEYLQQT